MAKGLDPQVLTGAFMAAMGQMLEKLSNIPASQEPKIEESEIIEYEGRMRVSGMEKFNSPAFLSVVNFYLNQGEMQRHKPKGALILYLEAENISKFLKAFGVHFADDEDDKSLMDACGKVCEAVAAEFKNELTRKGYVELVLSNPSNYKNNILEGIAYSQDQKTKQTVNFFYFKTKAIVADLTMADLPRK